jgi:glycosyltransferase involved in cell wall biosynthesis
MSDTTNPPLVTIGVPVYNGERFLCRTLDSLLAQEYANFELIISDNASTDATERIAREYAAGDARIRYYRNERNLGALYNFNRVADLAGGKYFMWASCHDLWHPQFVARCVETFEQDPSVVMCFPRAAEIDLEDRPIRSLHEALDTRGLSRAGAYRRAMNYLQGYHAYGLYRMDALRKVLPYKQSISPDALMVAEMAFHGSFAAVEGELFYLRRLPEFRDWRKCCEKIQLKFNFFNALRLCGGVFSEHLAIVRCYSRGPFERLVLGTMTVWSLLRRRWLWFGAVLCCALMPRVYYWLVKAPQSSR